MKELMRTAHKMTKGIKAEFPSVDYKAQLGICMSYLIEERKGDSKMKELKGTEKQIKWGNDILRMISEIEEQFNVALDELNNLGVTEESTNKEIDYTYLTIEEVRKAFENIKACEDSAILIDAFSGLKDRVAENLKKYNNNGKETGKIIWYRNTIADVALILNERIEMFEIENNPEFLELNAEGFKLMEVKTIRARMLRDINGFINAVQTELNHGGNVSKRKLRTKERSLNLLEKIKSETDSKWYLKSQYKEVSRYGKDWE